jgi:hypothetical protein
MKNIEPGMIADIIFEGDETKSHIPGLKAVIHAVKDRRIIMSQTEPPITKDHSGKRFMITFLEENYQKTNRYGVWAKLTGILEGYKIPNEQSVPALVMERESNMTISDLRMGFRVKPLPHSGLNIFFKGAEANIVNISIGGVCMSDSKDFFLKPQQKVTVTINIDGNKFDLEGMVIRTWSSQSVFGMEHFASLRFLSYSEMRESLLGNKIMFIDRRRLANRVE